MNLMKAAAIAFGAAVCSSLVTTAARSEPPPIASNIRSAGPAYVVHYRYRTVDGVRLFYREAGPPDAPVLLLLHGYPASSYMFRNLIPALSDRYRVIAPDYPGFGLSAMPDHRRFAYTFANFTSVVDHLLQGMRVSHYAMYLFDIGAPVGFRLALAHQDRVTAMVIQNGNAYTEGLTPFWDPIKAYWKENTPARRAALDGVVTLKTTMAQYLDGVSDTSRVDPSSWIHDQVLLDRPGNRDIQLDILHDYASNVRLYPKFHRFFRAHHPPTLIIWGKNDQGFSVAGARAYLHDLPAAEVHLINSGHFVLEDRADEAIPLINGFLDRSHLGA